MNPYTLAPPFTNTQPDAPPVLAGYAVLQRLLHVVVEQLQTPEPRLDQGQQLLLLLHQIAVGFGRIIVHQQRTDVEAALVNIPQLNIVQLLVHAKNKQLHQAPQPAQIGLPQEEDHQPLAPRQTHR